MPALNRGHERSNAGHWVLPRRKAFEAVPKSAAGKILRKDLRGLPVGN